MRRVFLFLLLAAVLVAAAAKIYLDNAGSVTAYFAPVTAYFANWAASKPVPLELPISPPCASGPQRYAENTPTMKVMESSEPPTADTNEAAQAPWALAQLAETLLPEMTHPESNTAAMEPPKPDEAQQDNATVTAAQDNKTATAESSETRDTQEPEAEVTAAPASKTGKPTPIIEVRLRQPGEKPGADAGDTKAAPEDQAKLDELASEIQHLRADVLRLQQTFDVYSGNQLADLQNENERLRQEIRQLHAGNKIASTKVPSPNKALLDEILADSANKQEEAKTPEPEAVKEKPAPAEEVKADAPADEPANVGRESFPTHSDADAAAPPTPAPGSMEDKILKEMEKWRQAKEAKKSSGKEAKKPAPKGEPKAGKKSTAPAATPIAVNKDGYQIVAEWGRTPEDAKAINKPEVSLKGMICVVPPTTDDAHLSLIGRKLRGDFANYNNLNIDVFDDVDAAKQFEKGVSADDHHVLSISKHPASNRDVILVMHGDMKQEIPFENGDSPQG